jgi:hypothetical protein
VVTTPVVEVPEVLVEVALAVAPVVVAVAVAVVVVVEVVWDVQEATNNRATKVRTRVEYAILSNI